MRDSFPTLRFVLVVFFISAAPGIAFAYIDPGSGAYVVQALFTLVGAALFYLRHPIRTLQSVWRRLFPGSRKIRGSIAMGAEEAELQGKPSAADVQVSESRSLES